MVQPPGPSPRDALAGKGPQRQPQQRSGRRLEEVAKTVGGGYCRLQMPLKLGIGWGALEVAPPPPPPMHPCRHLICGTTSPTRPPHRRFTDYVRLTCSSWGDPHVTMFSRAQAHPMGRGLYKMVGCVPSFRIHACHKPLRHHISVNRGFAIEYDGGVVKLLPSGVTTTGPVQRTGNTFTFPGGEVVSGSYQSLTVSVPRWKYAGRACGLCGEYEYDGAGGILDGVTEVYTPASGQPFRWGGPHLGLYQSKYAEAQKVPEAEALLTSAECPYEDAEPESEDPECPELADQAARYCPVGECYKGCKADVVALCDITQIDVAREACRDRDGLGVCPPAAACALPPSRNAALWISVHTPPPRRVLRGSSEVVRDAPEA